MQLKKYLWNNCSLIFGSVIIQVKDIIIFMMLIVDIPLEPLSVVEILLHVLKLVFYWMEQMLLMSSKEDFMQFRHESHAK